MLAVGTDLVRQRSCIQGTIYFVLCTVLTLHVPDFCVLTYCLCAVLKLDVQRSVHLTYC